MEYNNEKINTEDVAKKREFSRGQVYYIFPNEKPEVGHEYKGGRPAVIVSNKVLNETASVLEVCYFSKTTKKNMPTHAEVSAEHVSGSVLCEQIQSVSVKRVGKYIDTLSELDMMRVNHALRVALDIE